MRLRHGIATALGVALLSTVSAVYAEGPARDAEPPHGSKAGEGNSRGPGRGDGLGRMRAEQEANPEAHGEGKRRGEGAQRGRGDGSGREKHDAPPSADPLEFSPLDEVKFRPNAQYRLRYRHHEGQDFVPGGVTDTFRHRARAGMRASWRDKLAVFMQVQDVRFYGEELDTTADVSADGFDLRQGYAEFTPTPALRMRLGRQLIGWSNERLIGQRDWGEPAQAFDALRLTFDARGVAVDAFYARVRDGAQPGNPGQEGDNAHVAGFHIDYEILPALRPHVMVITERAQDGNNRQHTAGALVEGHFGRGLFRYSAEGYYQFGAAPSDDATPGREKNYSASMFAVDATVTLPVKTRPYAKLFGVFSSGDGDPNDNTVRTFDNPYGARHKFYGEFDQFTQLRLHTDGRGLRDIASRLGFRPAKGLEVRATHHLFQAMASPDGLEHFGHELDLAMRWAFWKYVSFDFAYALFVPGAIIEAKTPGAEPEHFLYSTTGVTF